MGQFNAEQVAITMPATLDHDSRDIEMNIAVLPVTLSGLLSMLNCEVILGMDWLTASDKAHLAINYENKLFSNY
jgi:hypothetical protein